MHLAERGHHYVADPGSEVSFVATRRHLFTLMQPCLSGYDERKMPMEPRVHIAKRSDLYSGQKRGTAVGLDVYVAC